MGMLLRANGVRTRSVVNVVTRARNANCTQNCDSLYVRLLLTSCLGLSPRTIFSHVPVVVVNLYNKLVDPRCAIFAHGSMTTPSQPPTNGQLAVNATGAQILGPRRCNALARVGLITTTIRTTVTSTNVASLTSIRYIRIGYPTVAPTHLRSTTRQNITILDAGLKRTDSLSGKTDTLKVTLKLRRVPRAGLIRNVIGHSHLLCASQNSISTKKRRSTYQVLIVNGSRQSIDPCQIKRNIVTSRLSATKVCATLRSTKLGPAAPLATRRRRHVIRLFIGYKTSTIGTIHSHHRAVRDSFLSNCTNVITGTITGTIITSIINSAVVLTSTNGRRRNIPNDGLVTTVITTR